MLKGKNHKSYEKIKKRLNYSQTSASIISSDLIESPADVSDRPSSSQKVVRGE